MFIGSMLSRASIGAALFPRDAGDGDDLLKSADIALYEAKSRGRARVQLFRSDMRSELQRRSSMISLARDALRRAQLHRDGPRRPRLELRGGRGDRRGRGALGPDGGRHAAPLT